MEKWSVQERFSDWEQMRLAVENALTATASHIALEEGVWYDLRVVLRELACNALEHGKTPVELSISTCCDQEHLHVLVCDAGEGFDPCAEGTLLEVDQARGRGLHIVNSLSEAMAYNAAANKVLVRLRIAGG